MPLRNSTRLRLHFKQQGLRLVLAAAMGVLLTGATIVLGDEASAARLDRANKLLAQGDVDRARQAASEAIDAAPEDPRGYLLRATIDESRRQSVTALADCDALLSPPLLAKLATPVEVYELRGRVRFYLGDARGSAADFDRAVELSPARGPGHWQRGISYYYAERYADGRRQFEGYQTVDNADVENAVWRYLCMARSAGVEIARREILKIGDDRRVPMRQIYDLFAGQLTPDEVLAAAEAGEASPAERRSRRFYAHLYVGLYYETAQEPEKALAHVRRAADEFAIGHYMADVARTHVKLRGPAAAESVPP